MVKSRLRSAARFSGLYSFPHGGVDPCKLIRSFLPESGLVLSDNEEKKNKFSALYQALAAIRAHGHKAPLSIILAQTLLLLCH